MSYRFKDNGNGLGRVSVPDDGQDGNLIAPLWRSKILAHWDSSLNSPIEGPWENHENSPGGVRRSIALDGKSALRSIGIRTRLDRNRQQKWVLE